MKRVAGLIVGHTVLSSAAADRYTSLSLRQAERELSAHRRAIYDQVLTPFLMPPIAKDDEAEAAQHAMTVAFESPEYRRAVFDLTLVASDEVAFGD